MWGSWGHSTNHQCCMCWPMHYGITFAAPHYSNNYSSVSKTNHETDTVYEKRLTKTWKLIKNLWLTVTGVTQGHQLHTSLVLHRSWVSRLTGFTGYWFYTSLVSQVGFISRSFHKSPVLYVIGFHRSLIFYVTGFTCLIFQVTGFICLVFQVIDFTGHWFDRSLVSYVTGFIGHWFHRSLVSQVIGFIGHWF